MNQRVIALLAKLISRRRSATALLLLVTALGNTFGADSANAPNSILELRVAIESVLQEFKTPGAAVAIVSRDKVDWLEGIGRADVAVNQPVTAETLFRIGSVSKSFAALAALKLQEEGKLKLTDTVRQWVPELAFTNPWEATDPVRLVHLMEHTSGFDDIHLREYAHNNPTPIALNDALAYGASSRVSRWRPGSRMAYCNSGPAVLAAVIEKVSGQRFEDYVQEHFFKPLRMDTASYFYTPAVEQRLTKLYRHDGITSYPYWHICFRPSGSVNASAKDMANYVRFYLQRGSLDGTQLLQPSSIERMETTETLPSARLGRMAGYGLYNHATFEGPFVFRGHGGAIMGGLTDMEYLSNYGRGYIVMINSGNGKALHQITKLVRQYLTRDLVPPALPPAATVSSELKQHYEGYYQVISPREQWLYGFKRLMKIQKLVFATDALSTGNYGLHHERWLPMSERLFRKEDQSVTTLALLPDEDGETLIQSSFGQMGLGTFKKVSGLRVWAQVVAIALVSGLVLSSLFFAPVWIWRKLSGKLHNAGPLSVRIMPLLGAVSLVTFDVLLVFGLRGGITASFIDDIVTLGTPSLFAVSIMFLSIALPSTAAASMYILYHERSTDMNQMVYWHSVLVTAALVGVAIYLGYWDLIGLRLWV